MKISDFIYRYPPEGFNRHDALCRVRIFYNNQDTFAVLTDLREYAAGPSVTNAVEIIKDRLISDGHIRQETKIIEHYESDFSGKNSFDIVSFDNTNKPSWKDISITQVISSLDCHKEEFAIETIHNKRLFNKIQQIRYSMNPYIDEPYQESPEIIIKREEIKKNMISKTTLSKLIADGAIETKIQNLINTDLSIISEMYAHPKEEYICFSQFPIDDGFVDFALFSGRSMMDITLIEIKGADVDLINQSGYKNFSSKINEAVQQLRKRLGYIIRNYEAFRTNAHKIREEVEAGKVLYRSLQGPKGNLQVDPNKDIQLHTVMIGGRSNNHLEESQMRYEYEMGQSPSIRIESWDSWLSKLTRQ